MSLHGTFMHLPFVYTCAVHKRACINVHSTSILLQYSFEKEPVSAQHPPKLKTTLVVEPAQELSLGYHPWGYHRSTSRGLVAEVGRLPKAKGANELLTHARVEHCACAGGCRLAETWAFVLRVFDKDFRAGADWRRRFRK